MTNKEYVRMEEHIKSIQKSKQTLLKVPYRDQTSGFNHMSKDVILKGYDCRIGKTLRYVDMDWNVDGVKVVGEEIYISLSK